MDEYLSEKEQIQLIRDWWRENGGFVMAGLILGLAVIGGWKYWQSYRETRAEEASTHYAALLDAVSNQRRDEAFDLSGVLTNEYVDTPYAAQAALAMAKLHMDAQEPTDAADQLRRALEHAPDKQLKHVARLRLARLLLDQGDIEEARQLVKGVDGGSFAPRYNEILGDIHAVVGNTAEARNAYGLALADFTPGVIDRNFVQMKLDSLALPEAEPLVVEEPEPTDKTAEQ